MKYANSITELIGNTPLLRLKYASEQSGANIFGKCEFFNPSGSVKDRIALGMIQSALKSNTINEKSVIIEPTSGNTGIGLAAICASLGIRLILTMPSSMSLERRRLLIAYGAELELTPPEKGMSGAVARAQELANQIPNAVILQQFENPANPEIHRETTAKEILEALDGKVDIFVAGVGTGGTLTGVGEVLKKHNPHAKVVAIEPAQSPVLSGGKPGPHKIQGIGAGFVPKILNTHIYDSIIKVEADVAFEEARKLAKQEGVLVGISSGANIWGAKQLALENKGANIVTVLCDTGERYLSAGLFEYHE